jgi:antitoxin (DNA-binding transcriptional repressor) of toxin-antitoxin stability system
MSRTIPHRELRNNSSAILRDVSHGETFQITNNGVVVALLIPPNTMPRPSLRVRKALTKGGFDELVRAELDHPIQEMLDDLRGDR